MAQHDVEVSTEEFDEPVVSGLTPAILAIASLVGIVLVGVGVLPLTLIGFLLAVAPAAVSVARLFGHRFSISFGPRAQSQNVVAVHRATGPLVTKGSRTIVVVAHYDSPHENPLYTSPVAPYLTLASRLTVPCALGVAVCAFIQILGFLPGAFRVLFWVVGILAAVPAAVLAAGSIAERMAPCTEGANDNKSGVAALLGVLENVRPSGAEPRAREIARTRRRPRRTTPRPQPPLPPSRCWAPATARRCSARSASCPRAARSSTSSPSPRSRPRPSPPPRWRSTWPPTRRPRART